MIELNSITKSYNNIKVVDNLSITITEGEITVLIGPSGCGKTTTLEMINGLIKHDSGEIYIDGQNITAADLISLRRRIGYVIQEVGLFPHYTVFENITTVLSLLKWDKSRIKSRVDELLKLVNLSASSFDKYPHQLSGGQQQRVGVARALAANPDYLLMDEPFGALDPINRAHLQDEFLRIQNQLKKTVVFVTHDMDEALKMGDRIAVMNNGELLQYDTPLNLLRNPSNEFVKQFVGSKKIMKALPLITISELPEEFLQLIRKEDLSQKEKITVSINSNLQSVLETFLKAKDYSLSVIDESNKQIGVLSFSLFKKYLSEFII